MLYPIWIISCWSGPIATSEPRQASPVYQQRFCLLFRRLWVRIPGIGAAASSLIERAFPCAVPGHADVRKALEQNPLDASAYRTLFETVKVQAEGQEDVWNKASSFRSMVRQVQIITALNHYLQLRPQEVMAHWELAQLYH